MATRAQFILTTGVSGSGKTYRRCAHFLTQDFLINNTGVHISNFPVDFDGLQKYCDNHNIKVNVRDRVKVIPDEILKGWLAGVSGPWDYFTDDDLSGCHLALDEAHNFCSKKSRPALRDQWGKWLAELRHLGMTAEFLTQNEGNMANEIMNQCEIRLEIINGENRIDPILHIRMSDWYELKAKITGRYIAPSYELEYMQMKGKWRVQREVKFYRYEELFKVYDSFSKPVVGKGSGKTEKRHYERMGWFRFLIWFFGSNFSPFLRMFLIIALFAWLLLFGGIGKCFNMLLGKNILGKVQKSNFKTENKALNDKSENTKENNELIKENVNYYVNYDDFNLNTKVKIIMINENSILLDDGRIIKKGDLIGDVEILSINYRKRKVLMSDMTIYDIKEIIKYY